VKWLGKLASWGVTFWFEEEDFFAKQLSTQISNPDAGAIKAT
jgi:hypothetical protein